MKRIGIRVDANEIIATGHVSRCLAIAEALRRTGQCPVFICADECPGFLIEQKGYEFFSLQSDWKNMEEEIASLQKLVEQQNIGILFVDSYYVTKSYLKKMHALTKVVYMDDLGKDVYDVDAIVCYANYYKDFRLEERYSSKVRIFQGIKYAPLRTTFSNLPLKEISPAVKKIIVLSGGTDPYDFLERFSEKILKSSLYETLEIIYVICGRYYKKYNELARKFGENSKYRFFKAVEDLEQYMLLADVAITAAGVTAYELCAAGVPAITYVMADNQRKNAESFHKDGLMEYAGDLRTDPVLNKIVELLNGKYQDYSYRKEVSNAMKKRVDGKGSEHVAKVLLDILQD